MIQVMDVNYYLKTGLQTQDEYCLFIKIILAPLEPSSP
jgi:hypothetical protein